MSAATLSLIHPSNTLRSSCPPTKRPRSHDRPWLHEVPSQKKRWLLCAAFRAKATKVTRMHFDFSRTRRHLSYIVVGTSTLQSRPRKAVANGLKWRIRSTATKSSSSRPRSRTRTSRPRGREPCQSCLTVHSRAEIGALIGSDSDKNSFDNLLGPQKQNHFVDYAKDEHGQLALHLSD